MEDPYTELKAAFEVLGFTQGDDVFININDYYEPTGDGKDNGVFISSSFDATSHFETTVDDVMDMYQRMNGKPLDLTIPDEEEEGSGAQ
jgi:Rab GDP dissociation inhibitor